MATKQTTQLCYQINGGSCKNKVSAANFYICAAGHDGRPASPAQESNSKLNNGVQDKHKLAVREKVEIAKSTSDYEIQEKLLHDKNEKVIVALSENETLSPEVAMALAKIGFWGIIHNLAKNKSIPLAVQQMIFEKRHLDSALLKLATNPSLDVELQKKFYESGISMYRISVGRNPSLDVELQKKFYESGKEGMALLANHWNLSCEYAEGLLEKGIEPDSFLNQKSLSEILDPQFLSLANKYPQAVSKAYLERLLFHSQDEDPSNQNVKALILHNYFLYLEHVPHVSSYNQHERNAEKFKKEILEKYAEDQEMIYLLTSGDGNQ